jgi:hypothetical protein
VKHRRQVKVAEAITDLCGDARCVSGTGPWLALSW